LSEAILLETGAPFISPDGRSLLDTAGHLWNIVDRRTRLRIDREADAVEVSWTNGSLEATTDLGQPWEVVAATSPWKIATPTGPRFFRVRR
jgi:hypothetical protein